MKVLPFRNRQRRDQVATRESASLCRSLPQHLGGEAACVLLSNEISIATATSREGSVFMRTAWVHSACHAQRRSAWFMSTAAILIIEDHARRGMFETTSTISNTAVAVRCRCRDTRPPSSKRCFRRNHWQNGPTRWPAGGINLNRWGLL